LAVHFEAARTAGVFFLLAHYLWRAGTDGISRMRSLIRQRAGPTVSRRRRRWGRGTVRSREGWCPVRVRVLLVTVRRPLQHPVQKYFQLSCCWDFRPLISSLSKDEDFRLSTGEGGADDSAHVAPLKAVFHSADARESELSDTQKGAGVREVVDGGREVGQVGTGASGLFLCDDIENIADGTIWLRDGEDSHLADCPAHGQESVDLSEAALKLHRYSGAHLQVLRYRVCQRHAGRRVQEDIALDFDDVRWQWR
jgi:hypothetical protein